MVIYDLNLRSYVLFTFDVIRLLGKGEFTASAWDYSPRERVDGLDSQGQLFCKEGSGLFCLHNLEMVEQQTFYMLYYQHSWASSTSTGNREILLYLSLYKINILHS